MRCWTLEQLLNSNSTAARLGAIAEIREIGTSVKGIPAKEGDKDKKGETGGLARRMAPALIKQMESATVPPEVRAAAAVALGQINPEPTAATEALGRLLTHGTAGERAAAADGLGWSARARWMTLIRAARAPPPCSPPPTRMPPSPHP